MNRSSQKFFNLLRLIYPQSLSMGDTLTTSKNFLNPTLVNTLSANRSKGRSKSFDTSELSNVKKIVLELPESPIRGRYHQVEYMVQLIDKPTKWYLQGEKLNNSLWYRHTISDNYNFSADLGLIRTTEEINTKLRFGFRLKEIIEK